MSEGIEENTAQLLKQWQSFTNRGTCDRQFLRPVTIQAGQRCRDLGIDPQHLRYAFLTENQLQQKRADHHDLIKATLPYMEYLSLALSDRSHVIALADAEGWILELKEHPKDAFGGRSTGICVGSSWNEKHIGNNGVGTTLARGEPTLVYGIEHYAMQYHSAHCLGVPIRINGKVVGCIDISVTREEDANPAHLTLAQACAASIESTLNSWSELSGKFTSLEKFAAMGSLLATTVHDLANPLHVIIGLSQIGATTAKDNGEREYFQKIIKHAGSLVDMLNRLKDFSQPQELVSVPPATVLLDAVEEIRPLCETQGIEVESSVQNHAEAMLQPRLFKRAIHNLLSNAIKAMPQGGRLVVRVVGEDPRVRIIIRDTGTGIPSEIQERAFEPFVHGREDGNGLGLYMVHQTITRDHNGKIWFESQPDRGTTFFIEIPAITK